MEITQEGKLEGSERRFEDGQTYKNSKYGYWMIQREVRRTGKEERTRG
jgi:hypothetical protein